MKRESEWGCAHLKSRASIAQAALIPDTKECISDILVAGADTSILQRDEE